MQKKFVREEVEAFITDEYESLVRAIERERRENK